MEASPETAASIAVRWNRVHRSVIISEEIKCYEPYTAQCRVVPKFSFGSAFSIPDVYVLVQANPENACARFPYESFHTRHGHQLCPFLEHTSITTSLRAVQERSMNQIRPQPPSREHFTIFDLSCNINFPQRRRTNSLRAGVRATGNKDSGGSRSETSRCRFTCCNETFLLLRCCSQLGGPQGINTCSI